MTEQSSLKWGTSLKQAWDYMIRGASDGLTASDALKQYRSGGGHIGNEAWYSGFRIAFSVVGTRESIRNIPNTYTVPESMSNESGFDWRREYVMQMEIRGYDTETNQWIRKWVTAESDILIQRSEWQAEAVRAMINIPSSKPLTDVEFIKYDFYHRIGRD